MLNNQKTTGCRAGKTRFRFVFICVLLALSFAVTSREIQNDTFYSIRCGQYLAENGIFGQRADPFSWIDLPYTYPHWLFDIAIFGLYRIDGFRAIYLACAVGTLVLGLQEYRLVLIRTGSKAWSLCAAAVFLLCMRRFIAARAQLVSCFLFGLELMCIEGYLYRGKKADLFVLPAIAVLIANVHAAVYWFFFVLAMPYAAEYICVLFRRKKQTAAGGEQESDVRRYHVLGSVVLGSAAAGLLSPFQPTAYTYLPLTVLGNSTAFIREHAAAVLWEDKVLFLYVAYLIFLFLSGRYRIRVSSWLILFGTLLMAVVSGRHASLFFLLSIPVAADMGRQLIGRMPLIMRARGRLRELALDILLGVSLVICAALVFFVYQEQNYINERDYPTKATEWIGSNLDTDEIRLFNTYNYGSYLLLNDIPVMIDSRADLYTPQFNRRWSVWGDDGIDVLSDVMLVSGGKRHYGELLEKYRITHVLIDNDSIVGIYIAEDPNTELLYSDEYFSVYAVSGYAE